MNRTKLIAVVAQLTAVFFRGNDVCVRVRLCLCVCARIFCRVFFHVAVSLQCFPFLPYDVPIPLPQKKQYIYIL